MTDPCRQEHGCTGNNLAADRRLDRDFKQMSGNFLFQLFTHLSAAFHCGSSVHNEGQGIHRLSVYQNIQFYQIAFFIAQNAVVKGCIAAASGFQYIEEVVNDLIQRDVIGQHRSCGIQIFHTDIFPSALLAQLHDRTDVILGQHDLSLYDRLFHFFDTSRVGHIAGIGQIKVCTVCQIYLIDNTGRSCYRIQIVFSFQSFLNDLQMQQTKEATTETEAQSYGSFRLEEQSRVIQL